MQIKQRGSHSILAPAAVNVTLRCWQRNFTLWTPSKTQIHEPSLVSFRHLPGIINKLMPPASSSSESTTDGQRAFVLKKPTKNKPAVTSKLIYSRYLLIQTQSSPICFQYLANLFGEPHRFARCYTGRNGNDALPITICGVARHSNPLHRPQQTHTNTVAPQ